MGVSTAPPDPAQRPRGGIELLLSLSLSLYNDHWDIVGLDSAYLEQDLSAWPAGYSPHVGCGVALGQ